MLQGEAEAAFYALRKEVSEETLRYQPRMDRPFVVTTDASEVAIGGILSQKDDQGVNRIVSAFSKTIVGAEANYSTTDKELLAIVKTLEYFRKYLIGVEFVLRTDHRALTYLWKTENLSGRLMRWSLKLQEYRFRVEYIRGEDNAADGLSRYSGVVKPLVAEVVRQEFDMLTRQRVLREYHEATGHGSADTIKFALKLKYSWDGIFKDIEEFVANCEVCAAAGRELVNTKNRVIESEGVNDLWEVDLIGRIECDESRSKFILVCVDHFSKWVEARVVKSKSADDVRKAFWDIVASFGAAPKRVLSDNGLEFVQRRLQDEAKEKGIAWEFCSPYHHKSTGAVERANQTLWHKIKTLSVFGEKPWEHAVSKAARGMNLSYSRAIGTSPYLARFGREPILKIDSELGSSGGVEYSTKEIAEQIQKHRLKYAKEVEKGTRTQKRDIEIGARVLVYVPLPRAPLEPSWEPGFTVCRHIGEDAYEVCNGVRKRRLNKIHVKRDVGEPERRSVVASVPKTLSVS